MFKLDLYKELSNKSIYRIINLHDNQFVGITFRNKYYNALIVIDHKEKEIVLHDIPDLYFKETIKMIREYDSIWSSYRICNESLDCL